MMGRTPSLAASPNDGGNSPCWQNYPAESLGAFARKNLRRKHIFAFE